MSRKSGTLSAKRQREIFLGALEVTAPAARAAFLSAACAGDQTLRQSVETLLREEREVGGFLQTPASEVRNLDP